MSHKNKQNKNSEYTRREIADYSEWEKTGNVAVDMVAACVGHYRRLQRPLKKIILSPNYYELFRYWVLKKAGEERALDAKFEFDSVDIEKGSSLQVEPLYTEFYDLTPSPVQSN